MFSQTVEYAMRAMIHLAGLPEDASVNSEAIAERTQVPRGYLSKVMRDLVLADLVRSQRGPNGGFCLARPASKISMLEVVNAVDPLHRITRCPLGNPAHMHLCPLHRRLDDAIATIETEFGRTSLGEVIRSDPDARRACRALTGTTVSAEPRGSSARKS